MAKILAMRKDIEEIGGYVKLDVMERGSVVWIWIEEAQFHVL